MEYPNSGMQDGNHMWLPAALLFTEQNMEFYVFGTSSHFGQVVRRVHAKYIGFPHEISNILGDDVY